MQKEFSIYKNFELQFKDITEWKEEDIIQLIKTQHNYAKQVLDYRKRLWTELVKLYNNSFRRKFGDINLGSKLIFTQFHETYSSIDNDTRRVVFQERQPQDKEKVFYTNAVAKYDFDEMGLGGKIRELNWDIVFFGSGIMDISYFDMDRKVLEPQIQSPFTFFIDPKAVDIDSARFAGRYIYKTYYELANSSFIDKDKLDKFIRDISFSPERSYEQVNLEKRVKQILLGENYYTEPIMVGSYIELLEWYFYNNGSLWAVWTDSGISRVLGFKKLNFNDKGGKGKESKIPFVAYHFIKTPFSFWGLGLPELIEDNHRADVVIKNYLLKGVVTDSIPSLFLNYEILLDPKDLLTKEINKVVWTKSSPVGQVMPFPKTQAVTGDVLSFVNILQNEAVGAIGSSRILKGSLTQIKKTATEIAIAKAKQDLQISSIMRNIILGDKDFWNRWLKRYKTFLKEDDVKLIDIVGNYGAKVFKEVKKKDFIPKVDPVLTVVSSLEAEPHKIIKRRELSEILPSLAQTGGNVREVLRNIMLDMDLTPEQVEVFLPPTPHELRAKMENELLQKDILPDIHENDNDLEHIAVHYRLKDENKVRNLHIQAHFLNYLRKQKLQEPDRGKRRKVEGNLFNVENQQEIIQEMVKRMPETEGEERIVRGEEGGMFQPSPNLKRSL